MEWIVTPYCIDDVYEMKKQGGCTSVVFGDASFSICQVCTLSLKDINQASIICKELDCKLYVSMNRMMFDEDLSLLKEHLLYYKDRVDGIYFADMSVWMYAKELDMKHLMIYQPLSVMTNSYDANLYLEEGMQRIVLADEITLEEIKDIATSSCGALELKVYGRTVLSYSKRPLLTNYANEIELNQNLKNNKNLSLMEETRDAKMPIYEDEFGTYIYSAEYVNYYKELNQLKGLPLVFKIDGIFDCKEHLLKVLSLLKQAFEGKDIEHEWNDSYAYSTGYLYKKTNLVK